MGATSWEASRDKMSLELKEIAKGMGILVPWAAPGEFHGGFFVKTNEAF